MDPDSPSGSSGAPEAPPPPSSTTPPPSQPEASTGVTLAVAPPPPPPPPPTSDQVLSTPSARATKRDDASASSAPAPLSRYESQKRRDWNTFLQYLKNHKPPLALARCSGAHVIEFLKYLDQFGKTKVHVSGCDFFGHPSPPAPCACPLRQAWGSLDALIGRLRAAFEENGGRPESNPFGARAVRIYLREVRESQAKARGIPYEKKKRKRLPPSTAAAMGTAQVSGSTSTVAPTSSSGGGGDVGGAGSVAAATSSSS